MAINIRNINEITFTQSFRGYNTDEVDDFLDEIYDEAVANNKEIDELKKRITELKGGLAPQPVQSDNSFEVIANAQQEADRILEAARQKAHALITAAEKTQKEIIASAASVSSSNAQPAQMSPDAVAKLKALIKEAYDKQMSVLNEANISMSTPAPAPVQQNVAPALQYVPPAQPVKTVQPVQQTAPPPIVVKEPVQQAIEDIYPSTNQDDIPSISFEGLTRTYPDKIPAERDILGEINAIEFGTPKPEATAPASATYRPTYEPEPLPDPVVPEPVESEDDTKEFTFSFGNSENDLSGTTQSTISFGDSATEDPDDIIAQILRDNNRN